MVGGLGGGASSFYRTWCTGITGPAVALTACDDAEPYDLLGVALQFSNIRRCFFAQVEWCKAESDSCLILPTSYREKPTRTHAAGVIVS